MFEIVRQTPNVEAVKSKTLGILNNCEQAKGQMYLSHLTEVERWANIICDLYPDCDREVVLCGVWTHDVGALIADFNNHEIHSEKYVLEELPKLGLTDKQVHSIAHCARTHRCKKDAMPISQEAKILATADSASHLTDHAYINLLKRGEVKYVTGKIDRDLRDIEQFSILPIDLLNRLQKIGSGWKVIIENWPD